MLRRAEALGRQRFAGNTAWTIGLHDLALRVDVQQERWTEARGEALALAALHGADASWLAAMAARSAREAVRAFFDSSADIIGAAADRGETPAAAAALVTILAGRTDAALTWLERSAAAREPDFLLTLRDPAFGAVAAHPRFRALRLRVTRR